MTEQTSQQEQGRVIIFLDTVFFSKVDGIFFFLKVDGMFADNSESTTCLCETITFYISVGDPFFSFKANRRS